MPFLLTPDGHYTNVYVLPTGATGTAQQLTNTALAEMMGVPSTDPGYTGAAWCNGGTFQLSKGATGP